MCEENLSKFEQCIYYLSGGNEQHYPLKGSSYSVPFGFIYCVKVKFYTCFQYFTFPI